MRTQKTTKGNGPRPETQTTDETLVRLETSRPRSRSWISLWHHTLPSVRLSVHSSVTPCTSG